MISKEYLEMQDDKQKKISELTNMVEEFYHKNNLDIEDLMIFLSSGIASIVANVYSEFDYDLFAEQIKIMSEAIKDKNNQK